MSRDGAVTTGAIQRHLDALHARIVGRLRQELFHRAGETFVGVVHQQRTLAHHGEDRTVGFLGRREATGRHRLPRVVLQFGAINRMDLHQTGEVDETLDLDHVSIRQIVLFHEQLTHFGISAGVEFQSHGASESASTQFHFDGLQKIVGVLVLQREVGVARDAKSRGSADRHPGEQRGHLGHDDLFHRHELRRARNLVETREQGWHLHSGETLFARRIVANDGRDTERQIRHVRKRVRRIHRQWRQNREDPLLVETNARRAFVIGEFRPGEDLDAFALQLRNQNVEDQSLLTLAQIRDAIERHGQLPRRRNAIGQQGRDARGFLILHGRHPNLEELVEVGGEDRTELHPFQQRDARLGGHAQHTLVEIEPTQLSVDDVAREPAGRGIVHSANSRQAGDGWVRGVHREFTGLLEDRSTGSDGDPSRSATRVLDERLVEAKIPFDRDVLPLSVTHDALTIALELWVCVGQQHQASQGPGAELVDQGAVAEIAHDVPVRGHGSVEDDPDVGAGRFGAGVGVRHGGSVILVEVLVRGYFRFLTFHPRNPKRKKTAGQPNPIGVGGVSDS